MHVSFRYTLYQPFSFRNEEDIRLKTRGNSIDFRYQCSFEGFKKQGHSESKATELMRTAVSLAHNSVTSHQTQSTSRTPDSGKRGKEPSVVLALSCYGAILSPGQEYSGRYPPPYGPHSTHASNDVDTADPSSPSTSNTSSSITRNNQSARNDWIQAAEQALEEWHFERLKVFASTSQEEDGTWERISFVAFETLPVLYEARAIRKAMTRLKRYLQVEAKRGEKKSIHWPKWWISFVFPDGSLPSTSSLEPGDLSPANIAKTVFKQERMKLSLIDVNGDGDQYEEEVDVEIPTGLGINCTKMRYLPSIVDEYTQALANIPSSSGEQERILVLYPDGGLVYDPVTKTWHQDGNAIISSNRQDAGEKTGDPAQIWASQLMEIARNALSNEKKVWDGIILGGCCKASPVYIAELSKLVGRVRREEGS